MNTTRIANPLIIGSIYRAMMELNNISASDSPATITVNLKENDCIQFVQFVRDGNLMVQIRRTNFAHQTLTIAEFENLYLIA